MLRSVHKSFLWWLHVHFWHGRLGYWSSLHISMDEFPCFICTFVSLCITQLVPETCLWLLSWLPAFIVHDEVEIIICVAAVMLLLLLISLASRLGRSRLGKMFPIFSLIIGLCDEVRQTAHIQDVLNQVMCCWVCRFYEVGRLERELYPFSRYHRWVVMAWLLYCRNKFFFIPLGIFTSQLAWQTHTYFYELHNTDVLYCISSDLHSMVDLYLSCVIRLTLGRCK